MASGVEHLGHLHRELTRGHQHERSWVVRPRTGSGALQQRQAERERLARARLGLSAHVVAGERVSDREALDGEWCGNARFRERVDECFVDP